MRRYSKSKRTNKQTRFDSVHLRSPVLKAIPANSSRLVTFDAPPETPFDERGLKPATTLWINVQPHCMGSTCGPSYGINVGRIVVAGFSPRLEIGHLCGGLEQELPSWIRR